MSSTTRQVSLSTTSTGMEISSECLQPSTNAKWIEPRGQIDGEIELYHADSQRYRWVAGSGIPWGWLGSLGSRPRDETLETLGLHTGWVGFACTCCGPAETRGGIGSGERILCCPYCTRPGKRSPR